MKRLVAAILAPLICAAWLACEAQSPTPSPTFGITSTIGKSFELRSGNQIVASIVLINSRVGGEWLTITRHNEPDSPDGFSPCYTEIHCAYKPVVTRNADGTYLIQFVSEITEK